MGKSTIHFLGIRHHGPGSARSVLNALETLDPDLILLEGPEEAEDLLSFVSHPQMKPPVALLAFAVEDLTKTVFYPFATFSPEWQTILYALNHKINLQFFDLPQKHQLALNPPSSLSESQPPESLSEEELSTRTSESPEENSSVEEVSLDSELFPYDPLDLLAESAGFTDGERWWEYMVEQRQGDLSLFQGIQEAMTEVRELLEKERKRPLSYRESLREAWMRRKIRVAQKQYKKIVVICGAWHVPALAGDLAPQEDADEALLKNLAKTKVQATWVPWTNGRISHRSGYGAGIYSPGWYEHLWNCSEQAPQRARKISGGWLAKVAHLLRKEGIDVSTASVIESVRLTETLAALREKPLPGLEELNEAIIATFCFGDETPLKLIREKLIIGERLGEVPETTPTVPLQQDLNQQQKRLNLKPEAERKALELDLRKEKDLEKSQLFHRLNLLNIPWGTLDKVRGGKGTFKENWSLKWDGEFAIRLIEASVWGTTIEEASAVYARQQLRVANSLSQIISIIDHLLLADLPQTLDYAVERLESESAVASDVLQLMEGLSPLANIMVYSNVRGIQSKTLAGVVETLITRICIGLPSACSSLDEDAAEVMFKEINDTHTSINLLKNEEQIKLWQETLIKLVDLEKLHGLISGRSYRLLLNAKMISVESATQKLSLALSVANDLLHSAAWVDGLLRGSGLLLIHDEQIWSLLDQWLNQLAPESFQTLLPLLRRTFSTFEATERRQIGEKVRTGISQTHVSLNLLPASADFDQNSAEASLPLVVKMLGLSLPIQKE